MAVNPLVAQGYLNKLLGSLSIISAPNLNVTASFLADDGIGLALEGNGAEYLGAMTGAVPSPNPYQKATVTAHMLRTQSLAAAWRLQLETNAMIGDITVTPDSTTLPQYAFYNAVIMNVAEMTFAGKSPSFTVTIGGTYIINSSLYD